MYLLFWFRKYPNFSLYVKCEEQEEADEKKGVQSEYEPAIKIIVDKHKWNSRTFNNTAKGSELFITIMSKSSTKLNMCAAQFIQWTNRQP